MTEKEFNKKGMKIKRDFIAEFLNIDDDLSDSFINRKFGEYLTSDEKDHIELVQIINEEIEAIA